VKSNTPVRDIFDLDHDTREIVSLCEVTGQRTLFARGSTRIAILISFDEYAALRETVDLVNDAAGIHERSLEEPEPVEFAEMTGPTSVVPSFRSDLESMSPELRETASRLVAMIDGDPLSGAPLFHPLRGLWSLRRDGLRIVYRIGSDGRVVIILKAEPAEVIA
jgi:mRNA-degrading endonuclease RelE of RelBE toxin-antitoxin system